MAAGVLPGFLAAPLDDEEEEKAIRLSQMVIAPVATRTPLPKWLQLLLKLLGWRPGYR